jgi:hypothetical protein
MSFRAIIFRRGWILRIVDVRICLVRIFREDSFVKELTQGVDPISQSACEANNWMIGGVRPAKVDGKVEKICRDPPEITTDFSVFFNRQLQLLNHDAILSRRVRERRVYREMMIRVTAMAIEMNISVRSAIINMTFISVKDGYIQECRVM